MELVLIRHGKTEYNERKAYCGSLDPGLTDAGKCELEASETKRYLAEHPPELVFLSPMLRVRETADVLQDGIPAPCLVIPELREVDFGDFEGKTYEELKDDPAYAVWLDAHCETAIPGGDFPDSFRDDVAVGFEQVLESCRLERVSSAAVITHGGVIGTILERFAVPKKHWYEWNVPCGGFVVLEGDDGFEVKGTGGGTAC